MEKSWHKRYGNPDLRRHVNAPTPTSKEMEEEITKRLIPKELARMETSYKFMNMRNRILTFPVMVAIVLSIVWRQIPSLMELLRTLRMEKMLWLDRLVVSRQAVSKRLKKMPMVLFENVYNEMIKKINTEKGKKMAVNKGWEKVIDTYKSIWAVDGSTLEELKKKYMQANEEGKILAGKMALALNIFTRIPVETYYTEEPQMNDKKFMDRFLKSLTKGGLIVFDLGFFGFNWFDRITEEGKYFVTRMRKKTSYEVVKVLSSGPRYRDEIIKMGKYRSNPCKYEVRMISVLWNGKWLSYITNELDSERLTAQQVCEMYAMRWRIEDAFNTTKRLLGLSYIWVGGTNGVQIQLYSTLIFYVMLIDICNEVSIELNEPLDRISVEMVFRSFYHYSAMADDRRKKMSVVEFIVEYADILDVVKVRRKRNREMDQQKLEIWGKLLS